MGASHCLQSKAFARGVFASGTIMSTCLDWFSLVPVAENLHFKRDTHFRIVTLVYFALLPHSCRIVHLIARPNVAVRARLRSVDSHVFFATHLAGHSIKSLKLPTLHNLAPLYARHAYR